jgi:DNA polymerase III alpha subunit
MCYQEQVMDILRVVGNVPDMHTEKVRKAISKKKVKDFIRYKDMFVENGKVNLGVNAEFCLDLWDQIESFAEYGFNRSHACAYAYISARLLWLKAHYPLEFYNAILMCESDYDKFREYKLDAKYHGVEINPVDINKSKVNFGITDDKIFFGFKNIKSIGEGVAERIVENQPYVGFPDFLDRFGTDAGTLKALCAIGVFDDLEPDYDHEYIRKFHEFYKDHVRKRKERQKRFETSMDKKLQELRELLLTEVSETDLDFERLCDFTEDAEALWEDRFSGIQREVEYKSKGQIKTKFVPFTKLLQDLARKRNSSLKNFHEKETEDEENPITLDQFNPASVKLDEEELAVLKNKMVLNGETTYPVAESMYYGFQWTHVLETSPDYKGETIDRFLDETENNPEYKGQAGPIEIIIRAVRKRTSKKGTEFYSVDVEDANARQMTINVWMDDYLRWREELRKDKMLRIRVKPPSGGFNTLTFDSVPKRERHKLPPKEDDDRIMVMRPAAKPLEEIPVDLDGFTLFDPDNQENSEE